MLIVRSPANRRPEREYIYKVMLEQFLGVPYSVVFEQRDGIEIRLSGDDSRLLRVEDLFLRTDESGWLRPQSLPATPLRRFDHPRLGAVPAIFGRPTEGGAYFERRTGEIVCRLDVFGSAFFMLTRYEECVPAKRDAIDRFPAAGSLAYREGFLHRPIVNEYLELLWECIAELWPGLPRKPRQSSITLSHDVDWPFYTFGKNRARMLKDALADAVKRQDFQSAYWKTRAFWLTRNGDLSGDPFNTFHWIMENSEKAGMRSAFYFITEETVRGKDGNYSIADREIERLMREIHSRGHEIGLHPSFDTYTSPERIKRQFETLLESASKNGIRQERWGGRQHFLRWKAPDTWQHWEDAGLSYDSTLGYEDTPGFRCGVCYEYPVFNLRARKTLRLQERPLVVMEQAVFQSGSGPVRPSEQLAAIDALNRQCKRYGGNFSLLWHNSQFVRKEQRLLYTECLSL
ncbi:polysaccharide deacetylase family protein [Cohnella zeiphila]|uniref:Polysaccharide deacetylase family protein n=1 Tax=Cohnella zeiphila TaxID=2761120 RepID=A0A7X0SN54_9BACL|nr:polysaccharide deacetylase family protein [Cohnella zeiphila]MBB6733062.1 polysaccharide deacetylase family protein [Cohnella zeiphila]